MMVCGIGVLRPCRKIFRFAADERAHRLLRSNANPALYSAVVKLLYYVAKRKKTDHRMMVCGIGVLRPCRKIFRFAADERAHRLLRLNANPALYSAVVKLLYYVAKRKKTDHRMMVCFLWQRNRDSNPNIQSQSLLCYLYTIPLFA